MATKSISWQTGTGNITLTYTGQGNGPITVESDANNLGIPRSQNVVVKTSNGAIIKNLTVNQAACPFPVGDIKDYSYIGSYQEVVLPAGRYKLQVWGAQGGRCSAGYDGGKGGYSEGVITLTSQTTVRIYVGGQGGSSSGGFNGGGSSTGYSSYSSGDTYGYSYMGGGGGATDIRLSDGALLSRMIVAGGGSGGSYCYKEETVQTEEEQYLIYMSQTGAYYSPSSNAYAFYFDLESELSFGEKYVIYFDSHFSRGEIVEYDSSYNYLGEIQISDGDSFVLTKLNSRATQIRFIGYTDSDSYTCYITIYKVVSKSSVVSDSAYQAGYAGGGTNGVGYSSSYYGKQNGAGSNGSFGQGANQSTTGYRYCSGAGGGGWYGGGGGLYSDSSMSYIYYMGGGSGWVNIAANAGNRPSGYTGLQLDSGATYAGNTSFESPSGGTETGHAGDGYARITRLE